MIFFNTFLFCMYYRYKIREHFVRGMRITIVIEKLFAFVKATNSTKKLLSIMNANLDAQSSVHC